MYQFVHFSLVYYLSSASMLAVLAMNSCRRYMIMVGEEDDDEEDTDGGAEDYEDDKFEESDGATDENDDDRAGDVVWSVGAQRCRLFNAARLSIFLEPEEYAHVRVHTEPQA